FRGKACCEAMPSYLEFERPVADLEGKIQELRGKPADGEAAEAATDEIARLEQKASQTLAELYLKLAPWPKVQVARHPDRPHALDYIRTLIADFTPLAGDRAFGEDAAIVAGLGRFRGRPIAVLGQEKGADTPSRIKHN